jgi:hypothetical protein
MSKQQAHSEDSVSRSAWDTENRFSKTHYETISRALATVRDNEVSEVVTGGTTAEHTDAEYFVLAYHDAMVHHLISVLKADNPRFDADKFWYHSTGKPVDKSICDTCLHRIPNTTKQYLHIDYDCDLHNSVIDCCDYADKPIVNTACSNWDNVNLIGSDSHNDLSYDSTTIDYQVMLNTASIAVGCCIENVSNYLSKQRAACMDGDVTKIHTNASWLLRESKHLAIACDMYATLLGGKTRSIVKIVNKPKFVCELK